MLNISGLERMYERKLFSSSRRSLMNSGLTAPFLTDNELLAMDWVHVVEGTVHPNRFA